MALLTREEFKDMSALITRKLAVVANLYRSTQLSDAVDTELSKLVNGLYGRIEAIEHEFMRAEKMRTKGRSVTLQIHADVSVGTGTESYAKSIECKNVTTRISGDVNTHLRDAVGQLLGLTGHHPRTGDARVIDIRIENVNNPWPFPGSADSVRPDKTQAEFFQQLVNRLKEQLAQAKFPNLHVWLGQDALAAHETAVRIGAIPSIGSHPMPHSSRAVVQRIGGTGGPTYAKFNVLTIKVRYDPFFLLTQGTPPNEEHYVSEVIAQAYYKGGTFQVEVVKVIKLIRNLTTSTQIYDRTLV